MAVVALGCALFTEPGVAEVQPGDVVTKANATAVADLVSPGIRWCLEHGMQMRIVANREVALNDAYREATERYAGQTQLAPDGRSLLGYVAGLPFPVIDPNDPQVARKIMWNYEHRPFYTDDLDARNFDADTGSISDQPMAVERHYMIDHLRALFYNGRLYVDPKPVLPTEPGVRLKFSLHPLLEPFDLKGAGFSSVRYLDPDRQDDTWLYLPQLRRVRRLSSAARSDALLGQDTDVDSYGGYAGQVPWFEWRFLGEKTVLASFHAQHFPVQYCPGGGDFVFCDDWEPREVYVIEGTPLSPQYSFGKRVLFVDKQTFFIAYSDMYDRAMQLWKVWINAYGFRRRASADAGIEYPDEMPFNPGVSMVDVQLEHATRVALPSAKFPGEQGWYFNQGEKTGLTEQFFTIAHMIETSH
jgi:hypothetical protein